MNTNKELFYQRCKEYFNDESDRFISLLNEPPVSAFVLNMKKANVDEIFECVDFEYEESNINDISYIHNNESIGKTFAYELGLIYPQDVESSLSSTFINDKDNIKTVIDLCAAPGGKTINALNVLNDNITFISNDISKSRAKILSNNLERLGFDNGVVTALDPKYFLNKFEACFDLVILDAPCSGEGMIRKYPEILDTYNLGNIKALAATQKELLEIAYKLLRNNGQLIYSTCTYAFEEDEQQVEQFLSSHLDMELLPIDIDGNHSKLNGTIKLSQLNGTEGQFIALMKKTKGDNNKIPTKKELNNNVKVVDKFIKDNLNLENYYLYADRDNYYISLNKLPDIKDGFINQGVFIGTLVKDRFEPSHSLYRSNSLRKYFKYTYDLSISEYKEFVSGNEIKVNLDNHYYLVTFKGHSLGFGKVSNKTLKNKYPKGLRRMV